MRTNLQNPESTSLYSHITNLTNSSTEQQEKPSIIADEGPAQTTFPLIEQPEDQLLADLHAHDLLDSDCNLTVSNALCNFKKIEEAIAKGLQPASIQNLLGKIDPLPELPRLTGEQGKCIVDLLFRKMAVPVSIPLIDTIIDFPLIELFFYLMEKGTDDTHTILSVLDIECIGNDAPSVLPGLAEQVVQTLFKDTSKSFPSTPSNSFDSSLEKIAFRIRIPQTSLESFYDYKNLFAKFLSEKVVAQNGLEIAPEELESSIAATCLDKFDIPEIFYQSCYAQFPLFDCNSGENCDFTIMQHAGETNIFTSPLHVSIKPIIEKLKEILSEKKIINSSDLQRTLLDMIEKREFTPSLLQSDAKDMWKLQINRLIMSQESLRNAGHLKTHFNSLIESLYQLDIWQACVDRLTSCQRIKEPIHPNNKINGWLKLIHGNLTGKRPACQGTEKKLIEASFEILENTSIALPEEVQKILESCPPQAKWEAVTTHFLKKTAGDDFNLCIALLTQTSIALQRNGYAHKIAPLWSAMQSHLTLFPSKKKEPSLWTFIYQAMCQSPNNFELLGALLTVKAFLSLCKGDIQSPEISSTLCMFGGSPSFRISDSTYYLHLASKPADAWRILAESLPETASKEIFEKISLLMDCKGMPQEELSSPFKRNKKLQDLGSLISSVEAYASKPLPPFWQMLAVEGLLACGTLQEENSSSWKQTKNLISDLYRRLPDGQEKESFLRGALQNFITPPLAEEIPLNHLLALALVRNVEEKTALQDIVQAHHLTMRYSPALQNGEECTAAELEVLQAVAEHRADLAVAQLGKLMRDNLLESTAHQKVILKCVLSFCRNLAEHPENKNDLLYTTLLNIVCTFNDPLINSVMLQRLLHCVAFYPSSPFPKLLATATINLLSQLDLTKETFPEDIITTALDRLLDHVTTSSKDPNIEFQQIQTILKLRTSVKCPLNQENPFSHFDKKLSVALLSIFKSDTDMSLKEHACTSLIESDLFPLSTCLAAIESLLDAVTASRREQPSILLHLETIVKLTKKVKDLYPTENNLSTNLDHKLASALIHNADKNVPNLPLILDACQLAIDAGQLPLAVQAAVAGIKMNPSSEERGFLHDKLIQILNKLQQHTADKPLIYSVIKPLINNPSLLNEDQEKTFHALTPLFAHIPVETEEELQTARNLFRLTIEQCTAFGNHHQNFINILPLACQGLTITPPSKSAFYKSIVKYRIELDEAASKLPDENQKIISLLQQITERQATASQLVKQAPQTRKAAIADSELSNLFHKQLSENAHLKTILETIFQRPADANSVKARLHIFNQVLQSPETSPDVEKALALLFCFGDDIFNLVLNKEQPNRIDAALLMWNAIKTHCVKESTIQDKDRQIYVEGRILLQGTTENLLKYLKVLEILVNGLKNSDAAFTKSLEGIPSIVENCDILLITNLFNSALIEYPTAFPRKRHQQYIQCLSDYSFPILEKSTTNSNESIIPHALLIEIGKTLPENEPWRLISELLDLKTPSATSCALCITAGMLRSSSVSISMRKKIIDIVKNTPVLISTPLKLCLSGEKNFFPKNEGEKIWSQMLQVVWTTLRKIEPWTPKYLQACRTCLEFITRNTPYFSSKRDIQNSDSKKLIQILAYLCINNSEFPSAQLAQVHEYLIKAGFLKDHGAAAVSQLYISLLVEILFVQATNAEQLSSKFEAALDIIKRLPEKIPEKQKNDLRTTLCHLSSMGILNSCFDAEGTSYAKLKEYMCRLLTELQPKGVFTITPVFYGLTFGLPVDQTTKLLTPLQQQEIEAYLEDCKKEYANPINKKLKYSYIQCTRLADLAQNGLKQGFFAGNYELFINIAEFIMEMAIDHVDNPKMFAKMTSIATALICVESRLSPADLKKRSDLILSWCHHLVDIDFKCAKDAASQLFDLAVSANYIDMRDEKHTVSEDFSSAEEMAPEKPSKPLDFDDLKRALKSCDFIKTYQAVFELDSPEIINARFSLFTQEINPVDLEENMEQAIKSLSSLFAYIIKKGNSIIHIKQTVLFWERLNDSILQVCRKRGMIPNENGTLDETSLILDIQHIILLGISEQDEKFSDGLELINKKMSNAPIQCLTTVFKPSILKLINVLPLKHQQKYYKTFVNVLMEKVYDEATISGAAPYEFLSTLESFIPSFVIKQPIIVEGQTIPCSVLSTLAQIMPLKQTVDLCSLFYKLGTTSEATNGTTSPLIATAYALAIAQGIMEKELDEEQKAIVSKVLDDAVEKHSLELTELCKRCLITKTISFSGSELSDKWHTLLKSIDENTHFTELSPLMDLSVLFHRILNLITDNSLLFAFSTQQKENIFNITLNKLSYLCIFDRTYPLEKIKSCAAFLKELISKEAFSKSTFYLQLFTQISLTSIQAPKHLKGLIEALTNTASLFIDNFLPSCHDILYANLFHLVSRNIPDSCFSNLSDQETRQAEYAALSNVIKSLVVKAHEKTGIKRSEPTQKKELSPCSSLLHLMHSINDTSDTAECFSQIQDYFNKVKSEYEISTLHSPAGYVHFKRLSSFLATSYMKGIFAGHYTEYCNMIAFLMDIARNYADNGSVLYEMNGTIITLLGLKAFPNGKMLTLSEEDILIRHQLITDWCKTLELTDTLAAQQAAKRTLKTSREKKYILEKQSQPNYFLSLLTDTSRDKPQTAEEQRIVIEQIRSHIDAISRDYISPGSDSPNGCHYFVQITSLLENGLADEIFTDSYELYMELLGELKKICLDYAAAAPLFKQMSDKIADLLFKHPNPPDIQLHINTVKAWCLRLMQETMSHAFDAADNLLDMSNKFLEVKAPSPTG